MTVEADSVPTRAAAEPVAEPVAVVGAFAAFRRGFGGPAYFRFDQDLGAPAVPMGNAVVR